MSSAVAVNLEPPYVTAAEALRDNPGQWQAYESKGNCVVLAGPGSGKTKTLTIKMAQMLAEDVQSPRGIACITFNTECAGELRRRLEQLGIQEGRNVFVGTIHSFCLKHVVLPYARLAGLNLQDDVAVALPSEQQRTFEEAFAKVVSPDTPPESWRTGFDKYRRTHLDRDAPEWHGDDDQSAALIEEYEASLRRKGLIDFDDMMLIGLRLIESHEWVRHCLRARFPILVVDEYQDLGLPLHRIVMALCFKSGMRLLAVGDPDQSIYGFAGANPALLQELAEHEGVEKVHLRFNYRSGQKIVDASEVALGEKRDYRSKGGYAGTINFYRCREGLDQQANYICEKIIPAALTRREGRNLGDIAVLYIDKNDGDVIERAVRKAGMKFIRLDRGGPYAKTPLIRWLEDCAAWCSGGWKTGKPRLSTLSRAWEGFNASIKTESALYSLKLSLVKFLFSHRTPQEPLRNWLADIQGSLLSDVFRREPNLRDETAALANLIKVTGDGDKLAELTVAGFGGQAGSPDHLNLITLHSAKGLEFDVVTVMGMEQGRLPSWAARTPESKREPRRLFYVGLTRARHEVHITFSGFTENRYGRRFENGPSEFVIEVAKRLKEERK
jgi:DNA helicase II / ATP-dependent DNA helicase PcrA